MTRFRDIKTLQTFAAVHASIHTHFNLDCHLIVRDVYNDPGPRPRRSGVNWPPERTAASYFATTLL